MFLSNTCPKVCTVFVLDYLNFFTKNLFKNLEISANNWGHNYNLQDRITIYRIKLELNDVCKSIYIRHCTIQYN